MDGLFGGASDMPVDIKNAGKPPGYVLFMIMAGVTATPM
jgi:hypothetical protein